MSRNRWLAGILSLLQPGLGQIYNGQPWKGLAFAIGMMVVGVTTIVLMLGIATSWWIFAILLTLFLFVLAGIVTEAARSAGLSDLGSPQRWYSRWYGYVGLLLLAVLVLQPALVKWIRGSIAEAFRIQNAAMAPTLVAGDYVMINKLWSPGPELGQVVEFSWAGQGGARYVKRIVALGGDTVQMRDRVLWVNGRSVAEPYVQSSDGRDFDTPEMRWQKDVLVPGADTASYEPTNDTWGPLVVPNGSVFVLGDNREASMDSRERGLVSEGRIEGRGGRLYLSIAPESGLWRWSRIGHSIR